MGPVAFGQCEANFWPHLPHWLSTPTRCHGGDAFHAIGGEITKAETVSR